MADGRDPTLQDYDGYIGELPGGSYQGRTKHYNWNQSHHRPYHSSHSGPPPPGPPAPFSRAQSSPHHYNNNYQRPHYYNDNAYSYYYHSNNNNNNKNMKNAIIKDDPYYNITRSPESPNFTHKSSHFVVSNVPSKAPQIMVPPSKAKVTMQRQYSEPNSKMMNELRNDLHKLPVTPPFAAHTMHSPISPMHQQHLPHPHLHHSIHELSPGGGGPGQEAPMSLMALGQPMSLKHSMSSTHVPNTRSQSIGMGYHPIMHMNHDYYYNHDHNHNSHKNHQNHHNNKNNNNNKGKKRKKKNKDNNNANRDKHHMQMSVGGGLMMMTQHKKGFDFLVHDLLELVKLRKKEVSVLNKEMQSVVSQLNSFSRAHSFAKKECSQLNKAMNDERNALLNAMSEEKDASEAYFSKLCSQLRSDISDLKNKNLATQVGADVTHSHLRSQILEHTKQLAGIEKTRVEYRELNMQYELDVIELQEEVNALKEDLDDYRHSHFLLKKRIKANEANSDGNSAEEKCQEYPPELVIQQNLIRAQVEFYLSDYNLKRDKRLLEKICKQPKRGYLTVDDTLSLSRVRQLCTSPHALYMSLVSSSYLDMILNEDLRENEEKEPLYIGRLNFSPPTEKEFPFRRSVYIYGLPWYSDEEYVLTMLQAFGGVTKVQFDHGPDTLDRQIMQRMLEKHRVYKLLSKDSAALTMEFNAMHMNESYQCFWCKKNKQCSDGYYHPKRLPNQAPSYRVCLQCGAAKAEEQSVKYDARSKLLQDDRRLRELLLGLPPRTVAQCKTALCVFASQRQASKCVYVRSRLSYDGAFATHYHHYSKLKKEIALSIKPKVKVIRNQPKMSMTGGITAPVFDQEHTAILQ